MISIILYINYTCFQYVKNEYCEWKQDISQHIVFENDTITLDLPHFPLLIVDQWKIIPTIPQVTIPCLVSLACSIIIMVALHSQIAKVNVHQFQQGIIIPCCSVTLWWTGGEDVQPLLHKVTIIGAKEPMDYVYMQYFPQSFGRYTIMHFSCGSPK